MKKGLLLLSTVVFLHSTPTLADIAKDQAPAKKDNYAFLDNLSGQMDFTTNYMFRGISQSANLPAIQGGLTYTLPLGLYLNLWGSNVKFPGTGASVEIDTIGGIRGDLFEEKLSYDINVDRYNYPGARKLNYNEINTLFNLFSFLQLGYSYSGNVYNTHRNGKYYNGGINYDIPSNYIWGIEDVNFKALMGHYSLPRSAGLFSYNDYLVGLAKKFRIYTVSIQWIGTNKQAHNAPFDENQVVGTINADF